MKKNPWWIGFSFFVILLTNACVPSVKTPSLATATPTPIKETSPTATTQTGSNCAYTWAYNSDEAGAVKARQGLETSGVKYSQASIQLFGENASCTDGSSRFLQMESTLNIQLPVEDLRDDAALGMLLRKILAADSVLNVADFIAFNFTAGDENASIRMPVEKGQQLLALSSDAASLWLAFLSSLSQTSVNGLAFSPDGCSLLTSSPDAFLRTWDLKKGMLVQVVFTGSRGGDVTFIPEGQTFMVTLDLTRLYHFADGSLIDDINLSMGETRQLSLPADARNLVGVSQEGYDNKHLLSVYARSDNGLDLLYQPLTRTVSLAVSPDSRRIAVDAGGGIIQILELSGGDPILTMNRQLPTPESVCSVDYTSSLAFSADGKILALSFCSEYVNLFDASNGELLEILQPGGLLVGRLAFSPDGKFLAIATHDGTELRSTSDWTVVTKLKKPNLCEVCTEEVMMIAFSADGSLLAASTGGKVEIWQVENATLLLELGI